MTGVETFLMGHPMSGIDWCFFAAFNVGIPAFAIAFWCWLNRYIARLESEAIRRRLAEGITLDGRKGRA